MLMDSQEHFLLTIYCLTKQVREDLLMQILIMEFWTTG